MSIWVLIYYTIGKHAKCVFTVLAKCENDARMLVYKKVGDDAVYNPEKTHCTKLDTADMMDAMIIYESYEG